MTKYVRSLDLLLVFSTYPLISLRQSRREHGSQCRNFQRGNTHYHSIARCSQATICIELSVAYLTWFRLFFLPGGHSPRRRNHCLAAQHSSLCSWHLCKCIAIQRCPHPPSRWGLSSGTGCWTRSCSGMPNQLGFQSPCYLKESLIC